MFIRESVAGTGFEVHFVCPKSVHIACTAGRLSRLMFALTFVITTCYSSKMLMEAGGFSKRPEARLSACQTPCFCCASAGFSSPASRGLNKWRRGDSKPKSSITEEIQQPYNSDTESPQVQTDTNLTSPAIEQDVTDSVQNRNSILREKYAICMHQNSITDDLALVMEAWPELPEYIKVAIKTLVNTHIRPEK
jgi:hypothetical protein